MANCSAAIQILPMGAEQKEVLEVVDKVIEFIQSKTDQYEVSSFETTIEGEYDEVMTIVTEAIKIAGEAHSNIFSNLKVSYNSTSEVLSTDEKTEKYRK